MSPSTSLGLEGGYFGPALTPSTSADPLLLRDKLQTEEAISALRKRKGNKSGAFYKEQVCRAEVHRIEALLTCFSFLRTLTSRVCSNRSTSTSPRLRRKRTTTA